MRRRFFKQLEQFIGTRLVHAFGQPDYAHLISALTRLQTQLARQGVALSTRDYSLLVLGIHLRHPLFEREIRSAHYHLAPQTGIVVARRLVFRPHTGLLYSRIAEHKVWMSPLVQQSAMTKQFRCESHGKRHLAAARRTDNCHALAGLHGNVERFNQRTLRHIAEADV